MRDEPTTQEVLTEAAEYDRRRVETIIAGEMMRAMAREHSAFDDLSTWLAAGAAAVASFFIANADKLMPIITPKGFAGCGAMLGLSCLFGLLARVQGARCRTALATREAVVKAIKRESAAYAAQQKQVAQFTHEHFGLALELNLRRKEILSQYAAALPAVFRWLQRRDVERGPKAANHDAAIAMRLAVWQAIWFFLQVATAILFIVIGFIGAYVAP